jgi:spermidine synthase
VSRFAGAAALGFSGAAALIFQLLWIKQLSIVVGVDVYAVTIAVSAFFAGLAAGSAVFGRRADPLARPLRLYAALEGGIGALGVAATVTRCLPRSRRARALWPGRCPSSWSASPPS